jgi:predicted RNA-binding protein YlxR (DUF448 family)
MASHVPTRTCVACRARGDKAAFVRVVRQPDGAIVMDEAGHLAGRGAYLCADRACWALALKRGALQRALRAALPAELKERLEQGALVASPVSTGRGAPQMLLGGSHGT